MEIKKKTYKTKKVNIVRLSAFYEQVRKDSNDIKKEVNGK
jgi:hypothetical protein